MNTQAIILSIIGIIALVGGYFIISSNQIATNSNGSYVYENIAITPVDHASMVIRWDGDIIVVDPIGDERRYEVKSVADMVVITDIHKDHLSTTTLQRLDTDQATLVAPDAVIKQLGGSVYFNTIEVMNNGDEEIVNGYTIKAIPMYNVPETEDSYHPKGRGNGYVIEKNGVRIYIAGDTGNHRLIRGLQNIDIAFVPMNEPFTMTVKDASEAVLAFAPNIVYPYHYRGKEEYADINLFKELVLKANPAIEVRLANWYPEQELGTSLLESSLEQDPKRAEFEAAASIGTEASYQAFIKANRDHPLAEEARFELNNLRGITND